MRKTYLLTITALCILFFTNGIQAQEIKGQILDTLLDNGGYRLHFNIIRGKGIPILFESGDRDNTAVWKDIAQPLAEITEATIITYDRQGFGKSTVDPNRKGIEGEIQGLEKALEKLGYFKEIMLVSHSMGGAYNTVFAARNAQKVKGIVFIDARIPCLLSEDVLKQMNLHPAQAEIVRTLKDLPSLATHIPVIDIVSEQSVINDNNWKILHDAFVSASPNRRSIMAYKAGHYIFKDNSRLIVDAIVSLYAEIQNPKEKVKILERAYSYELSSANDDYLKKIEYEYSENDLIEWGKRLLMKDNTTHAIEILKLNTVLYPTSLAARNALAEACLKTGNTELAALAYKKLLEMDPGNRNAQTILEQIGRIIEVPDSILMTYAGEYELNGIPISLTKEKGKLFLNFNNTRSAACFTSTIDFFISEYRNEFRFIFDPEGKVQGFNLFGGMKAMKKPKTI